MNNITIFNLNNPLSFRIKGSGEYVKQAITKLVEIFNYAEDDHLEDIRQDYE